MARPAPKIIPHPSPNFGPRRDGARPALIVLHYTAMHSAKAALKTLCTPENEVSAHYLIGHHGDIWQLVDETQRAWHAGAGQWGAITDVNSHSIGIELDNSGDCPFAAPLMTALEWLLPQIMQRWDIPAAGVIAHSDLAPTRKIDPGRRFDWQRLARQGLALWPGDIPLETDPPCWSESAARFGYPVAADFGPGTDAASACLAAFRSRFRPWASGPEDAEDARLMAQLADQSAS
ncbi:N-acetylmuramoyl-L-alanine amidase [Cognatishimia sp. SS12]|uniref:N-acetylmuramoyl-L-alanine amidase n=1 Tax=Cognatishimia sp. SS12 TaxID=2979465 RepID=UPI00232CE780|nr:N-acetylmuramoyl-L-alanine amidase [Cognatishimia sp. SS12]MDC0738627.1 N-acetylmuramoyl-L-alanine amidase [Cognatishimia sp. SS12]